MNPKHLIYRSIGLVIIILFSIADSRGQALKTYINKNQILIGEHIHYEIKLSLASSSYSVDFGIPDSIPHFDIIDQKKYDTVGQNGIYSIRQTIDFTSFDSGIWKFPSFPITISFPNKAAQKAFSDSVFIRVSYSPADSTNELRDIKPVMKVFVVDRSWMYIAAGIILLLILLFILYRYFKNRKKKAPLLFNSSLSAFEEAIKALKQLQQETNADGKTFHTSLSNIFKKYYSRKINKNLLTSTTGDILLLLKTQSKSSEIVSQAAEALRSGDAAKFAKYQPSAAENNQSLLQIKQTIEHLDKKSSF